MLLFLLLLSLVLLCGTHNSHIMVRQTYFPLQLARGGGGGTVCESCYLTTAAKDIDY